MNVITDDAQDGKGSKMNTAMSFVLYLNHGYLQSSENKNRPQSTCLLYTSDAADE